MNPRYLASGAATMLAGLAVRSLFSRNVGNAGLRFFQAWLAIRSPSFLQNRNFYGSLVTEFSTEEREVWLTIDDGPCRHDTESLLDVLEEFSAKASFFVIGKQVERYPGLARLIADAGHRVENHTYSHRSGSLWVEPDWTSGDEIRRCSHAIRCAGVRSPEFFRSPGGRWSPPLARASEREGLRSVGWSVSGGDGTCCGDLWASMNRLLAGTKQGSILLFHQGGRTGRVEALRYLLFRLNRDGWKTVFPEGSSLL